MSYGLSCQCDEQMIANCNIPGNEVYIGLLCAILIALMIICKGDGDEEEEDDRPSQMYN